MEIDSDFGSFVMLKIRTIIAVLSGALFLLVPMGTFGRAVMCYGANGHVALEASEDGWSCNRCMQKSGGAQLIGSIDSASVFSGNSCDPCVDIPLTFSSIYHSTAHSQPVSSQYAPHILTVPENYPNRIVLHPENFFIEQSMPASDAMLNCLGSIILLI